MTDKAYNGWTNYETWVVNLWLMNNMHDPEFYEEVRACETEREAADMIEQHVDDLMDAEAMPTRGLFHDLLQGALSEVDWHEIAKDWRDG